METVKALVFDYTPHKLDNVETKVIGTVIEGHVILLKGKEKGLFRITKGDFKDRLVHPNNLAIIVNNYTQESLSFLLGLFEFCSFLQKSAVMDFVKGRPLKSDTILDLTMKYQMHKIKQAEKIMVKGGTGAS